jgi:16S rRNA (adenine1518-N6/adenine1519-N6)-dimethyltransferase
MSPAPPFQFPAPKATLTRFGLHPKRSFGQNFLADNALVERIALLAGPERAHVVEIGAGLGGLTACLLNRGHQVTAIERDRDMIPVLRELFQAALDESQLTLLEADAKAVSLEEVFGAVSRRVLVGNLPYQITGPLLQNTVTAQGTIDLAVFLVQKEVADRLTAKPSTKAYGALSVFCQAGFTIKRAFVVRRGAFYPQPNVDSAVVTLTPLNPPQAVETELFRTLVHGAFRARRKVLRNAWKGLFGLPEQTVAEAAQAAEVSLDARGETLDVAAYARMEHQIRKAWQRQEMA